MKGSMGIIIIFWCNVFLFEWYLGNSITAIETLPDALCSMLLLRCEDLEKLVFGGEEHSQNNRQFDVQPLFKGRWPKLHSLVLDHAIVQQTDSWKLFIDFLSNHPMLKLLDLPCDSMYGKVDLKESNVALDSYGGCLWDCMTVAPFQNLKTLRLCSKAHSPDIINNEIRPALNLLNHLTTLDISINLASQTPRTAIMIFHSLLVSCHQLLHFKVSIICPKYGLTMVGDNPSIYFLTLVTLLPH